MRLHQVIGRSAEELEPTLELQTGGEAGARNPLASAYPSLSFDARVGGLEDFVDHKSPVV